VKKTDVQQIKIESFDYTLPDEKIAKFPLPQRDDSKLLVYQEGNIQEGTYKSLPDFLTEGHFLMFNNTKVVQARLYFENKNGAKIEIFCLQAAEENLDVQLAMQTTKSVVWNCLVGNAKKWKEDFLIKLFEVNNVEYLLKVTLKERLEGSFNVIFDWGDNEITFAEVLEVIGNIPLPPYMKRVVEKSDENRYQTVYAEHKGSVAAPTAGLHFTKSLKTNLEDKGVSFDYLTLHVGAGTFMPVKSESMGEHDMHDEEVRIGVQAIRNLQTNLGKIIAVGTTSCRSLESLFWLGNQLINSGVLANQLTQWTPYETNKINSVEEVLDQLINYCEDAQITELVFKTSLIIAPGYKYQIIDGLITNFHQPKSTLLLLVAALIGGDWVKVYDYAKSNDYRFLSYGDGCLLMKPCYRLS
jgi:S-adenosylmethionine:tRNA ribosyltransferase-isomerase